MVKEYVLKPIMSDDELKAREGTYFKEKDIKTLINHDSDIYGLDASGNKVLIAKFRKGVFPKELIELAWEAFHKAAAASRNRGAAAGPINLESPYWKKRKPIKVDKWSTQYMDNGKLSKMRVNNLVFSSVLGYFERTPFMKLPCRLTSYTQQYFKQYKKGLPFLQEIDRQFKKLVPERYKAQRKIADKNPAYRIPGTAFSSLTINRNFQTALHQDAGDLREGFGNLSVVERGHYHGGYTMFPRYGIGFDLRAGDFIAMDVHDWHCNTEMYETKEDKEANKKLPPVYTHDPNTGAMGADKPYSRISFVCYYREKLQGCDIAETKKYYDKIEFDPEHGKREQSKREQSKREQSKREQSKRERTKTMKKKEHHTVNGTRKKH